MELMGADVPTLELGLKTFINADGSVDGELRLSNLPESWRDGSEEGAVAIEEFLARMLREVGTLAGLGTGDAFWISIGVRFGPQNDSELGDLAELYKRFRGLLQVAAHATEASYLSGMMNNVLSIGVIIKNLIEKRGLPPTVIFIRFTWTPDGVRPSRYEGERGEGR